MIAGIWAALQTTGLVTRLAVYGGLLLAVVAAYGVWHHSIYSKGYQAALADIARADAKAVQRATAYRNKFKDCRAAGKAWDQVTGTCQ